MTEASIDPRAFLRLLVRLRYLAVLGQAATVALVQHFLRIPLPAVALYLCVATLLALNLAAHWRVRRPCPVRAFEAPLQLTLDLLALSAALYFAGGPTNPFVSLYLVPIALASIALGLRTVFALAGLAVAAYTTLLFAHVPLPHAHGGGDFDLHVLGMWVNFLISVALLVVFVGRFMRELAQQRRQLTEVRERALRDEAVLALGTLAAGTAHELNTPLATMGLLLDEWRATPGAMLRDEDLALMRGQLERCRSHVRTLAALAREGGRTGTLLLPAAQVLRDTCERWQLLRPGVRLRLSIASSLEHQRLASDETVVQALANLLDNAADASLRAGVEEVDLDADARDGRARVRIADRGAGFAGDGDARPGPGLGIGLMISNATVERCGGRVLRRAREGGGSITEVQLPLREAGA